MERCERVRDLNPGGEKRPKPVEHQPLDISRRDAHLAGDQATPVVAVSLGSLCGMGRRHPIAAGIDDQARQQARRLRANRQRGREAVAAIADLGHHQWLRLKSRNGSPPTP